MKKNGRLIIADCFLARKPTNDFEESILEDFYEGFALENIASRLSFENDLKRANFKNVKYWGKTNVIIPKTTTGIYKLLKLSYPLFVLGEKLKITPKSLTGTLKAIFALRSGVRSGLFWHGVFYAEK